jgi:hypothetical protein
MNALTPKGIPLVFLLVLTFTLGLGGVAVAQTPDREPPANEGVCDVLLAGSTHGLYGLCVAYCEALDCDRQLSGNVQCNNPPSSKILENYNRLKQEGDPEMPCRREGCPCFNEQDLDRLVPTLDRCTNNLNLSPDQQEWVTCTSLNTDECANPIASIGAASIANWPSRGGLICLFTVGREIKFMHTTPEEAVVCDQRIQDYGALFGWDCFQ